MQSHHTVGVHILTMFILMQLVGCNSPPPIHRTSRHSTEGIKKGIPMTEAISIMEKNGFNCGVIENGTFTAQEKDDLGRPVERAVQDITFIKCIKTSSSGVVRSKKQVALILDTEGNVSDILQRVDNTAP